MASGRRKSSETTSSGSTESGLRKTMPTRFADDDERAPADPPTYQSSRGGWFQPTPKPVPGTPR
ncbi:hypothetical protein ACFVIY_37935 [Streptomyces sp. NPDC127166]|uniref:hypothetical protein n=1 Tax=Streptomyces sp. NPDC127166 TaxID=3345380 RepID=UPI00364281BB